MKLTDFYRLTHIRNRFEPGMVRAVRDHLGNEDVTPERAAEAVILLSACAAESDIEHFGQLILNAKTDNLEPETLREVLGYILSDELTAACIEQVTFDRRAGRVLIRLIDYEQIKILGLPLPATPTWKADAGVVWDREELVLVASELQADDHCGEILTEAEYQNLIKDLNEF